ncbi:hypothetical protein FisN_22Lh107 [Fistulifera solaris]|uniref:Uncharacterized protein n=1 Tax=Fistulifera solaris TaxID=1519565 RepID=A0A1Z5JC08_FISSO|nr:hypothetical protein FisN_22Lh107 [Fistulifera solaris]|eukprot:GAX11422.1 hypothetical protein FisN_22Lh107 [Fistulifera solaris]
MTAFSVLSFISSPATHHAILKGSRTVALGAIPDYADMASSFFTGMRVPSSLIAGSAFGAMFALSGSSKEYPRKHKWLTETYILYHVFSLLSVILSLNVIVVSTATANGFLLLGSHSISAKSCHDFMMQACPYEFTFTRWSFFMSLFAFLNSVTTRAILEFDLLRPDRGRARTFLLSSMLAMKLHLWSFLTSYATDGIKLLNLWEMTATAFRLYIAKSSQTVTGIASIAALAIAAVSGIVLASRPLFSFNRLSRKEP